MLDIEFATMYYSFVENLKPCDFLHGIYKSIAFGAAIALSSCYFGVTVRGGAVGVGRAVNAAVVAAAVSIMLLDFFLTYLTADDDASSSGQRRSRSAAPRARRRARRRSSCGSVFVGDARRALVRPRRGDRPQGELARQMHVDRQQVAAVHRRHARLHRHGDGLPGVPAARRAITGDLLAGRRAVPPPDRLGLRPDA